MANTAAYQIILRDKVSVPARKAAQSSARMRKEIQKMGDMGHKTSSKLERFSASVKKAGNAMKKAGAASGAFAAGAAAAFGSVEEGTAKVLTLAGTAENMDRWRKRVRKALESSIKLGFSVEESSQALFDSVSALGTSEQAMESFQASQRLAIAGNTSIAASTMAVVKAMRLYKEDGLKAAEATNIIFTAQRFGVTDVEKFAASFPKVSSTAKSLGVGMAESAAVFAEMTGSAPSSEVAATNMVAIMSSLMKPGKEQRATAKRLGIPVGASQIRKFGLAFTFAQISRAVQTDIDTLEKLMPNIRAMRGIAGFDNDAFKRVAHTQESIAHDLKAMKEGRQTSMDVAASEKLTTLASAMHHLKGTLLVLMAAFGEQLAPAIKFVAHSIEFVLGLFLKLPKPILWIISMTLTLVAGLTALALAWGPIVVVGAKIVMVVKTIAGVLGLFFTGIAVIASIPVWAVAAIAAALTVLMVSLFYYWDELMDYIKSAWAAVKEFAAYVGLIDGDMNLNANANLNSHASMESTVTVKAEKGTVTDIASKSSGSPNLKTGIALETS
jgi:TP901 family phage tail tape measure protein